MIKNINIEDDKERGIYFHEMAEDSRSLELLLHTCYNNGIVPTLASKGHGKNKVAYIILTLDHAHLNTIGRLIDLTLEIPDSEFNIRSSKGKIYAELSCESKDDDQLFTRIKEIVEEQTIENKIQDNSCNHSTDGFEYQPAPKRIWKIGNGYYLKNHFQNTCSLYILLYFIVLLVGI